MKKNEVSFPVMFRVDGKNIEGLIIFDEFQTYSADLDNEDLCFAEFDQFTYRWSDNLESFDLEFAGRRRHFKNIDDACLTLAEAGILIAAVDFSGEYCSWQTMDNDDCSLTAHRVGLPSDIEYQRSINNLYWPEAA